MILCGFDPWIVELEDYFEGYGDPDEVWEGKAAKNVQRKAYLDWVMDLADWKIFVTLTFREDRPIDSAKKFFERLVKALNVNLLGKRYKRIVGKSYFSFVLASEYQLRGVIHFHFLADRPLNFRLLHDKWNEWAGFAETEIIANRMAVVRYVVKYLVKNGEPEFYSSSWEGEPIVRPTWWDLLYRGNGGEK
jgi:hypothetical protein